MSFSIVGITWHLYGLVVGLALVAGWWAASVQARWRGVPTAWFEKASLLVIGAGFIGARAWHVVTDWVLYLDHPWMALAIWRGGLSIVGAILGGMIGLGWVQRHWPLPVLRQVTQSSWWLLLDIAMFGLPIGQAIGRWGNFVNQELYGPPSTAWWAISIAPENRLAGFERYSTFQPLFAYEMVATSVFAAMIWSLEVGRRRRRRPSLVGRGEYACAYAMYYGVVRFGLDFIRLAPAVSSWWGLGVNQWLMMALVVAGAVGWIHNHTHARELVE